MATPQNPALINLTKSIALAESGGGTMTPNYNAVGDNGTSKGAYQFNGDNFETWASQYGYDPKDFSPTNQNQVALARVTDLHNQGLSPAQIAAAWNAGEDKAKDGSWQTNVGTTNINGKDISYDTPGYVKKVNSIYQQLAGGGQADGTSAGTPDQPPQQGGNWMTAAINGVKNVVGSVVQSTGQDFASLGHLPAALTQPGTPDFWSTIGGSINALSDVAMAGGILVGDIATDGANVPANAEEMAGGVAARNAAEKGAGTAIKGALGKFAAGRGAGLAAQSVAGGAAAAAKTKGQGGTNTEAVESGVVSAGVTAATFGLMNWGGSKIANGFTRLVSKTGVAGGISKALTAATDYIKSSAVMSGLKTAGEGATAKLNAAAEQVVIAAHQALGGIASGLKTPTTSETGAMVQRVSANVSETGNRAVEGTFNRALTALNKFTISKDDVTNIAAQLAKNTGKKVSSMAEALAGDAESTVAQRSQLLLNALQSGTKETVGNIINGLNIKTPEAVEATLTSSWWQAIKKVVGSTPEGQDALQAYTDAMTARAQQSEQATFADTMRHSMAGGWERVTSATLGMLKDAGSVTNLKQALGDDFGDFQKNLTQKVIADATRAYQTVVHAANGVITPATSDVAHKALSDTVDAYMKKFGELPGLLSNKTIGFLADMKNGIPTVSSLADNLGIDGSKIIGDKGEQLLSTGAQMAQKGTQEIMQTVQNSPVGKALASKTFSELPSALMSSSKEEITAVKQMLGENSDEWKTLTSSVLGNIMQKVTGLFGSGGKDEAEKFLQSLSSSVGGDKEKYSLLFDAAGSKGKQSAGTLIQGLTDLANAVKSGSKPAALAKAGGAVLAYSIHHVYMAAMMARDSAKEFMSTEDSSLLKQLASKTPAQITAELRKGALEDSNWMVKAVAALTGRVIAPLLKYEVAQKLGQGAGATLAPASDTP